MTRFEKWSVWVCSALCGGTGLGYLWVKYFMKPAEPWAVINSPIQPWLLKGHIVTAPLLVFALGTVAGNHFWKHFRAGVPTGRRTGLTAMLSVAPLVLTGYLIQVFTGEGWVRAAAFSHMGLGFLYLGGLVLHQRVFRAGKRRRRGRPNELPVLPRSDPDEAAGPGADTDGPDPRRVSTGSPSATTARPFDRSSHDSSSHGSRDSARSGAPPARPP